MLKIGKVLEKGHQSAVAETSFWLCLDLSEDSYICVCTHCSWLLSRYNCRIVWFAVVIDWPADLEIYTLWPLG